MERTAIEERLRRQPFRPFRIVMSSGDKYEVCHPEMAMLLRSRLIVALPTGNGEEIPDQTADCSLLHVTGIEDFQVA